MTRWQTFLACAVVAVVAAQAQNAQAKKTQTQKKTGTNKQAKGAQSQEQTIQVNRPYCDEYLPYTVEGTNVTLLLQKNATGTLVADFLSKKLSTTVRIPKTGPFSDPGYPILSNPARQFQASGADLTRLITRLTYPKETPLCQDLNPNPDQPVPGAAESQYFLVHVVRWQVDVTGGGGYKYTANNSQWYVFYRSDAKEAHREVPFTFHPLVSSDMRMFGSKKVFFLSIHVAPQGDYQEFARDLGISYKPSVQKIKPVNWQDLTSVLSVYGIIGAAATQTGGEWSMSRSPGSKAPTAY